MCHHYRFRRSVEEAIEQFGVDHVDFDLAGLTDFYPGKYVPAIRGSSEHERELVGLHWSIVPRWWNPEKHTNLTMSWFKKNTYNARSESIHEKNSYRGPFKTNRCLLIATDFFERGLYFSLKSEEIFAIAGVWDRWQRGEEVIESVSMATTNANEQVARVHPKKRMPVILRSAEAIQKWLSPDITTREPLDAMELFEPFPDVEMESIAKR